ncbi:Pyruvate/2-oxoglutarate dehydrogenase complex, dihydrolipoamide dehydrogenase (E3) component [Loktanella sp. DSM 29012]|uniref:dihydrolipoyl dehydrogenase family protein n=1 Tax=Loktanella sp. DSM 29012 TaxID=1881056 RepID=UPI0008C5F0AE|nr:FAD-dependent oxidoreductase [Loktanella sp. DSM 29012]SEQ37641.1 Pyruvate/2-oxoglutarate dehydrogenase complex, dihydrolipoamide dehydrogenase (E3) component [Loktanella sp. DSM 29012]
MTKRIKTDLCVIGAGSAGLSVAAGAAQMGADVVLIEGHKMGGDCLNYGCIPSKALIASAKHAHAGINNQPYGVADVWPAVDYAAAKDHVQRVVDTIAPVDSQERFEGLGCTVIRENARFISDTEVQAGDTIITARRFVVATGSGPLVPPIDGLDGVTVHTNETIFDLRERPDHLLVIGGGPIGMEMAQAHRRLGCKVTVIEGAKAMGKDDPELAAVVLDNLRAEGVEIIEDAKAERVSGDEGQITVHTSQGDFTGSHLLMAVGRKVNVDRLDLEKGRVKYDRGGLKVDANLRSVTNKRVYAAGDVAGGLQFTHVAGYHGGQLVRSLMFGLPAKARTDHIPWVTYTDPELAQVGLTEAQARKKHGAALTVVRSEFEHNDRANTELKTKGLIKVMVVKGKPVGASIAGHMAGELIAMWSMAIANGLKMTAISNTVLPYPTYNEINKRAAGAYFTPKLFESDTVKMVVGLVQRWLP